jgi:hypothetical protein
MPDVIDENVAVDPSVFSNFATRINKVHELKVEDDFNIMRMEYETHGVFLCGSITKIPELSLRKPTFSLAIG